MRRDLKFSPMELTTILKYGDWDLEDEKYLINIVTGKVIGELDDGCLYINSKNWADVLKKIIILDKICVFYKCTLELGPGKVQIKSISNDKCQFTHSDLDEALVEWHRSLKEDIKRYGEGSDVLDKGEMEFINFLENSKPGNSDYIIVCDEIFKRLKEEYGWYVTSNQKICCESLEVVGYMYEGNIYVYKHLEEVQEVLEEFKNTDSEGLGSSGYSQIYGNSLKDREGETVLITTLVSDWKKYTEITGRTIIRVTLTNATEEERKANDCISWIKRHVAEINGALKLTFKCDCKIDVEEFMAVVITQIMGSWTPHYKVKEILNSRN